MRQRHLSQDTLKIGAIVDTMTVPAWVHRILSDVEAATFLDLSLFVLNRVKPQRSNFLEKLRLMLPTALYRLYERLDYALYRDPVDAFAPMDISAEFEATEVLEVVPIRQGCVHEFHRTDVQAMRARGLDVILHFGLDVIEGQTPSAAKFGVWSCWHGDPAGSRGGAALFWEIYEQKPSSESSLRILTIGSRGERTIYRSWASTNLTSLYRNRNPIYWKTSQFVIRRLRDLYELGWHYVESMDTYRESVSLERGVRRPPQNALMIGFLITLVCRFFYNRFWFKLFYRRWYVGLRKRRKFEGKRFDSIGFMPIRPPRNRFYADPFFLVQGETTYLFFEDGDCRTETGVIACCQLTHEGTPTRPKVVLERDYHLSYPFVFEHEGAVYMLPETVSNRTIELYKASDFPDRWQLHHVIFEGVEAVDSTIFEHGGKFWLFTGMAGTGTTPNDELFLFYADSPLGTWTAHPRNPIVSDVRRARPAGNLFLENGQIIRPGQDCSREYGYAITLSKVETVTETEYKEVELGRIEAGWLRKGLTVHTFNRTREFEALDGRVYSLKWLFDSSPVPTQKQT